MARSTLNRSFSLLRTLASSPDLLSVADLSRRLDIPPATIARLLQDLCGEAMVREEDGRRFGLGPEALRFAWHLKKNMSLERLARPVLRDLVGETGETASISRYIAEEGVSAIAMIEEAARPLSYVLEVGEIKHLNAGATGKSILAFLAPNVVDAVIAHHHLPQVTDRTTIDGERLSRELREIRDHGFAMTRSERVIGAVGIAAPIFSDGGRVFGCVGVTTPEHRFADEMADRFSAAVRRHSKRLSELLGGGAPEDSDADDHGRQ